MQEYAIIENGETFHVFRDGNWEYLSNNGIRVGYLAEKKQYDFSITESSSQIKSISPFGILSRVELIISELWKFVK